MEKFFVLLTFLPEKHEETIDPNTINSILHLKINQVAEQKSNVSGRECLTFYPLQIIFPPTAYFRVQHTFCILNPAGENLTVELVGVGK